MHFIKISVYCVVLFSITAADEITKYDSTYSGLNFTFGYMMSGWCEYRHSGLFPNNKLICDPIYKTAKPITPAEIVSALGTPFYHDKDNYQRFKTEKVPDNIADKIGDSVTILWSGGKSRAIIGEIGYFEKRCIAGIVCNIGLLDTGMILPKWDEFVLVLRQGSPYKGVPCKLIMHTEEEPEYCELMDSISWSFFTTFMDDLGKFISAAYPVKALAVDYGNPQVADSLIVLAYADMEVDYIDGCKYCAFYLAYKERNEWKYQIIEKPRKCGIEIKFGNAFDLNQDGILEYLIIEETTKGVVIDIYSLIHEKWKLMAKKEFMENK